MQKFLVIDYETFSEADITQVGGYEYAVHPSTEVLCVAFKLLTFDGKKWVKHETSRWDVCLDPKNKKLAGALMAALDDPSIKLVAHNALFEQLITRHVLPKHLGGIKFNLLISRWICTASLAATHALPRNLAGACDVLKLPIQKDPEGKKLIRKLCMPQKPTKKNPETRCKDTKPLLRFGQYCSTDVDAESELFLTLPPLHPQEREVWKLNQRINLRGVYVDRDVVEKVLKMMAEEQAQLEKESHQITGGISVSRRAAILKWLRHQGLKLPNLQAKTVADALESGLAKGPAARVLSIRQSLSKTSTAKYEAFEFRSRSDSRVRDLQLFFGARTGREAGMGIQPHNFPRGALEPWLLDHAFEAISTGDLEWCRAVLGDPMTAFSSTLRGVIRATPGGTLYCGDFNAIEARVVFWLALHDQGLKLFTGGTDPYVEMASLIFGVPVSDVTEEQRFVGKQAILGCGFGMGDKRFREQCKSFGKNVSAELAKKAVHSYRKRHAPVVSLWANIERAAIAAVQHPEKSFAVNRTKWFMQGKFLYCELPSGRRLAYFDPQIKFETKWERKHPVLYHWGVDSITKQWVFRGTYGGKLTENVTQAVARDFMVTAQLRTEKEGYIPLMSVHDELLSERLDGKGSIEEFETLMSQSPEWGKGCPIKVKAYTAERYKK